MIWNKISKILILAICLSAATSFLSAKSYTKLHNLGSAVYWESNFPEEVIGVKLTVKYYPQSESQESVVESQFFAAEEPIAYPFESGDQPPVFGNGSYKWELSLIVAGMNVIEPQNISEGEVIKYDENGRSLQHLANAESAVHAHRNVDASAKVTSGFFRVINGSVLGSRLNEQDAEKNANK